MNTINVLNIIITIYLYRRNLTHAKFAKLERKKIAFLRSSLSFGRFNVCLYNDITFSIYFLSKILIKKVPGTE